MFTKIIVMAAASVLALAGNFARGANVPLPRPRPANLAPDEPPSDLTRLSPCQLRLSAGIATVRPLPPILGPGECGGSDIVQLESVTLPDNGRVAVRPAATLRCTMAEAIVDWIRADLAPAAAELGSTLRAIENEDSFECRGRNRVVGAKLSEHGRANALDVQAIGLADGRVIALTGLAVSTNFRESLRRSACARFTTVLGPGSDGAHEDHIHVDLAERRGGFRICQWEIRD